MEERMGELKSLIQWELQLTGGLIRYQNLSAKQYGTQLYVLMRLTEEGGNNVNVLSEYPVTEHLKHS